MSERAPLIIQLQMDALDSKASVNDLLRKAKLAASKLSIEEAVNWIVSELDGYSNIAPKDLPAYRQLRGNMYYKNPYNGWQPVVFQDQRAHDLLQRVFVFDQISALEDILNRTESGGEIGFTASREAQRFVHEGLGFVCEITNKLNRGSIINIVESVRNLVLDWSVGLEKAGILGEGFSFSEKEQERAGSVTQHIFAGNIGVLGNVSDNAQVSNKQSNNMEIDIRKIEDTIRQIEGATSLLPETNRRVIEPLVLHAKEEISGQKPDVGRIRTLLSSIRAACEGASGNLAAEGIMALIKGILS